MKTTKVLHIISGLDTGGAEMMLYKLLATFPKQEICSEVISLRESGPIATKISGLGIEVHSLKFGSGWGATIVSVFLLVKYVRSFGPNVIQGWMYHGNVAATIASLLSFKRTILCWNIRQTLQYRNREKTITSLLIRLSGPLSHFPSYILYNSSISADQHERFGFCKTNRLIIPNGFDVNVFRPQAGVKKDIRDKLDLNTKNIVGHIARYHPKKDHENLLKAVRLVVDQVPDTIFLLIGRDVTAENRRLTKIMEQLRLENNVRLLGERMDISRLMLAMDILVSSSAWGEGFPNVIGEAMASGVTCVVTDVGESRSIVGDTGKVVPNSSPELIAEAVVGLLELTPEDRLDIGRQARERIRARFAIQDIALRYLRVYGCERNMRQVTASLNTER